MRKRLVHLLSLALLFTQLGMLVHAGTHLDRDPHAPYAGQTLCDDCVSFSSLQNVAAGGPITVVPVRRCTDQVTEKRKVREPEQRGFSGFRSRAPPSIL